MANYTNLKNIIDQYITTNGQGDITGAILNDVLKSIVNSIGADFLFGGIVEPSSTVGTPDQNVFYIAIKGGTYTNFGNVVIPNGITIFKWNGSWSYQNLFAGDGGVFDISAYHNNTKYADLTSALGSDGTNVPQSFRKGGMSVKFVRSFDDKYVQYRLISDTFSTTESDWQGVDDQPMPGSNNLIKSGGVYKLLYGELDEIEFIDGKRIVTSPSPISFAPITAASWRYALVECTKGDAFLINGIGGGDGAALWTFVDANGVILTQDLTASGVSQSDVRIVAPATSAYLVIDDFKSGGHCYKVTDGINQILNTIKEKVGYEGIHISTIKFTENYRIPTNVDVISFANKVYAYSWRCADVECAEGDVFLIHGIGGDTAARLWTFVDSDGHLISGDSGAQNGAEQTVKLIAPNGAAHLILNDFKSGFISYKGLDMLSMLSMQIEQIRNASSIDMKPSDITSVKCIESSSGEYTYIGRWFLKTGTSYMMANADGSSILCKVSGSTSYDINFSPDFTPAVTPYFAYSVDGSAFTRQSISNPTITLSDTDEHILWIVVDGMTETEPGHSKWYGNIGMIFQGITGGSKKAMIPSNKNILFIGDSIVEGINVLGTGANANVNSATNGFAFRTARALNAIPLMCGYGGTTAITGEYNMTPEASFKGARLAIEYNYYGERVNALEPDLILIEHGYNDASVISGGTKTTSDFINAYTSIIERLNVMYPGVPILCMIPFKQSLAAEIRQVAATKSYCFVIETADYGVTYSDTAHPDVAGAKTAAVKLSEAIIKLVGKDFFMNI